jgi:hypothetical protein
MRLWRRREGAPNGSTVPKKEERAAALLLVRCVIEMPPEGRARQDAMRGAKRSDTRRYREHLQRRSAPGSRGQRACDFSDAVD